MNKQQNFFSVTPEAINTSLENFSDLNIGCREVFYFLSMSRVASFSRKVSLFWFFNLP